MHTETEIVSHTGHSYESIENYIGDFAKVLALSERGFTPTMIRLVTGRSMALVRVYLKLVKEYSTPDRAFRLHQLKQDPVFTGYGWTSRLLLDDGMRLLHPRQCSRQHGDRDVPLAARVPADSSKTLYCETRAKDDDEATRYYVRERLSSIAFRCAVIAGRDALLCRLHGRSEPLLHWTCMVVDEGCPWRASCRVRQPDCLGSPG